MFFIDLSYAKQVQRVVIGLLCFFVFLMPASLFVEDAIATSFISSVQSALFWLSIIYIVTRIAEKPAGSTAQSTNVSKGE